MYGNKNKGYIILTLKVSGAIKIYGYQTKGGLMFCTTKNWSICAHENLCILKKGSVGLHYKKYTRNLSRLNFNFYKLKENKKF